MKTWSEVHWKLTLNNNRVNRSKKNKPMPGLSGPDGDSTSR